KLAELYKADKAQVSVFGIRTVFGGGKSTGFALIYDSHEALKKFEPHYRLVRYGDATKIEKASRQQRTFSPTRNPSNCNLWSGILWRLSEWRLTLEQASRERTRARSREEPTRRSREKSKRDAPFH